MKLLITYPLDDKVLTTILADNITYRPDLEIKGKRFLQPTLAKHRPDILITRTLPSEAILCDWYAAMPSPPAIILVGQLSITTLKTIGGIRIYQPEENLDIHPDLWALQLAERISTRKLAIPAMSASRPKNKQVILVGAGIVNLITAFYLVRADYHVVIIDALQDPRDNGLWSDYGCSHGGHDARMFTLTEADSYHDQSPPQKGKKHNSLFRNVVGNLGWDARKPQNESVTDAKWIQRYEAVPPWLARIYERDILSFNAESLPLWLSMRAECPELFEGVLHDGIVRLFADKSHYQAAKVRHSKLDSLVKALTQEELSETYPGLAIPSANGMIAGAMETIGFTVNIHQLTTRLLAYLEKQGVHCCWKQPIKKILRNDEGDVTGLISNKGEHVADHYVLSPGAFGNALLRGSVSDGAIHGVLGAWAVLPNLEPRLHHSLKIARKNHITEDMNVTVATDSQGQPILILGSGYGFTGIDPENIAAEQLDIIYQGIEDTARHFFPAAYNQAQADGSLKAQRRYCIRPWTATGLGIFESMQTAQDGLLIITGGHNTGGFAQAPAIGMAVLASLQGKHHPMQTLYHPARYSAFTNTAEQPLLCV
ncbi:MAG: FAD-binding oxidoreductase [Gammaproteobacteria bacterium]|nr:FAD-binding oxidoreductase [Gammaproteobacteria bacterium]